jgi:hypothetical protein
MDLPDYDSHIRLAPVADVETNTRKLNQDVAHILRQPPNNIQVYAWLLVFVPGRTKIRYVIEKRYLICETSGKVNTWGNGQKPARLFDGKHRFESMQKGTRMSHDGRVGQSSLMQRLGTILQSKGCGA